MNLKNIEDIKIDTNKKYIVFGSGVAGQTMMWYLSNIALASKLCVCDNSPEKHNARVIPPIYSVAESLSEDGIYIVAFFNNDKEKLESVETQLSSLGVRRENILFVNLDLQHYERIQLLYVKAYIRMLLDGRIEKESIRKVENIIFLSYGFTAEQESIGGGGPIGAICMQKKYIGNMFKGRTVEYPYYDNVKVSGGLPGSYIVHTCEEVKRIVENGSQNSIYVANDIFSAFALYILGKNYCLIYHGQGDLVRERTYWGTMIMQDEQKFIQDVEKIVIKNACQVLFPSLGAQKFFEESFHNLPVFCTGEPLYNAIYDIPIEEEVEGIKRDDSYVTFLSIGQMTWLKGLDRIPQFLKECSNHINGKQIRWIVVADGVLKKNVDDEMKKILFETQGNIIYVNFNKKLTHAQIFYLLNIADAYLMLHRVSIFDFSTLEAMFCRKPIILSNIAGNIEYNKKDNILLIDDSAVDWDAVEEYLGNMEIYGDKNRDVYDTFFSKDVFEERYSNFLNEFLDRVEKTS